MINKLKLYFSFISKLSIKFNFFYFILFNDSLKEAFLLYNMIFILSFLIVSLRICHWKFNVTKIVIYIYIYQIANISFILSSNYSNSFDIKFYEPKKIFLY